MKKEEILKEINLEYQFDQYLKRVGVTKAQLSAIQYQEMKRAFYGACGQMLVLLRDSVGELSDADGVTAMQDMMNQIQTFWEAEVKKSGH